MRKETRETLQRLCSDGGAFGEFLDEERRNRAKIQNGSRKIKMEA